MLQQTISHYRLLYNVGSSLLGEVYLAEDQQLGRKVALLFLPEPFSRDPEQMRRLAEEARSISALNHPNIRMMYEVGHERLESGEQYFIANEWVEGPTLREHLASTRMRMEEVLDTMTQIVTGLAAAHAAGILHRDLKPENVMIRPDGYIKILDFGLAKLIEHDSIMVDLDGPLTAPSTASLPVQAAETAELSTEEIGMADDEEADPYTTRPLDAAEAARLTAAFRQDTGRQDTGRQATGKQTAGKQKDESSAARRTTGLWWMPGTTGYLSPEQVRGEAIDERSDLFSLGVMVYEMCSGRLPFDGQTTTGVLSSILEAAPPPIRRFMPDAPEELEWIVTKLLAKERDERYQTARELLNDLKRLRHRLEFGAQQANQEEAPSHDSRRSGRNRSLETTMIRRDSGAVRSSGTRAFSDVIDSLAVLPLANAADDPTAEYLSDGITESIIRALSRVPRLRVMARSTVFRYKNKNADPLEVGRELKVRAVFAGRLLQRGDTIIIKAELIDAEDGSLLWAEQYQRKAGDVFELEQDIAKQISESLRMKLSGDEQQQLAHAYTANPEAYELYLRGLFFWNQRNLDTMPKGIEAFIQAIRKDPNYALPYAGLANFYILMSVYSLPPREFVPKARMAVKKALELDSQLSDAHASLGGLALWYDWDFIAAERQFKRAIEINPSDPNPYQWSGYLYAALERMDDAVKMMRRAQSLDPLSIIISTNLGEVLYRAGRYDEALAQFDKSLEMDPQFSKAIYWRSLTWIMCGRAAEAVAFLEAAMPQFQGETRLVASFLLLLALAHAGQREAALKLFGMMQERAKTHYVPPYYLALSNASLGNKEEAFAWLEKAYQERSGWLPWLKQEPLFDELRTDVRFSDLLRRIGLQP